LYAHFGYQGALEGFVSLKDMKDIHVNKLMPSGWHFIDNNKKSLLSAYEWEIHIDTNILNDSGRLKEYFVELVREIYWSLGYDNLKDEIMDAFLTQGGFSF